MKAIARQTLLWVFLMMLALPAVLHAQNNFVANSGTIAVSGYTDPGNIGMSLSPVKLKIAYSMLFFSALLPLFFWVRGVSRGSKGDLAAATMLLLVVSFFILAVNGGCSCGFSWIGLLVMLKGGGTFVGGASAESACFRKRSDRIALGILLIVMGFILTSIV